MPKVTLRPWPLLLNRVLMASQHSSGNKKAEEDANKEAEGSLAEIKKIGDKSGDKVVNDLLKIVMTVKPEVPEKIAA